ncbi:MAG: hypothetical protein C0183_14845 [Roseiflexus castenholzii]|nr:MAG: hypothetical protein C0183_14845 [Roseiflexus castenholzii]
MPETRKRTDGCGSSRCHDREILNGILWIMRTGTQWKDMPKRYSPYQTYYRRFQERVCSGAFEGMLKALVQDMTERGDLNVTKCFIDGAFVIAKKRSKGREKPSRAKG